MPLYVDYSKYPFVFPREDLKVMYVDSPGVIASRDEVLRSKLSSLVKRVVEAGEVPSELCSSSEECVLLYYAVLDVAKAVGDKWFQNRVALAYSKYASQYMEREDSEKLLLLGRRLGLDVFLAAKGSNTPKLPVISKSGKSISFIPCEFAVSITSYLRVVSKRLVHDPLYGLTNNTVSNGYVYLDKMTYQRVLEEAILNRVLEATEESTPLTELSEFAELVNEVKRALEESRGGGEATTSRVVVSEKSTLREPETGELPVIESLFPPCIARIIEILKSGGNPSHVERFNLAAFLGSIGLGVEAVLEYFKTSADFNEKIARYQIEHILGLRGNKKKYLPYSCERMRATGICPVQEQCKGGRNPVAVYKYAVRTRVRSEKSSTSRGSRDDDASEAAGGI